MFIQLTIFKQFKQPFHVTKTHLKCSSLNNFLYTQMVLLSTQKQKLKKTDFQNVASNFCKSGQFGLSAVFNILTKFIFVVCLKENIFKTSNSQKYIFVVGSSEGKTFFSQSLQAGKNCR